MAIEKGGSRMTPPGGRRRRAPTIDLPASEIGVAPAASEAVQADQKNEAARFTAHENKTSYEQSRRQTPPPANSSGFRDWLTGLDLRRWARVLREWPGSLPRNFPWPLIGAAAGLGLIVAALWFGGVFTGRADRNDAIDARLAKIEAMLSAPRPGDATLARRVADTESAGKSVREDIAILKRRFEEIASTISRPSDPALANRIANTENAAKSAGEDIAGLKRRVEDIASSTRDALARSETAVGTAQAAQKALQSDTADRSGTADTMRAEVESLANRVAAIERSVKGIETELSRPKPGIAGDGASRLAVVASALRAAVERGASFRAELAAAKSLAPDPKILAPLEGFAVSGVPSASVLSREWSTLAPTLLDAVNRAPRDGGFFEKLQVNAERLVRIRPAGDVAGDEPPAVIARIETKMANADINGVLADLTKLPASVRAPSEAWVGKVKARQAAVEASDKFMNGALAAFSKPEL